MKSESACRSEAILTSRAASSIVSLGPGPNLPPLPVCGFAVCAGA